MNFNSKEEFLKWCDHNESTVKKAIDNIIDGLGVKKKEAKNLLKSAFNILNELHDLKKEIVT